MRKAHHIPKNKLFSITFYHKNGLNTMKKRDTYGISFKVYSSDLRFVTANPNTDASVKAPSALIAILLPPAVFGS